MRNDRPAPSSSGADTLFFKPAAVTVLGAGVLLHAIRIVAGESTLTDILTPTVDGIFGLVMAYAAVAGWLSWRKVEHPGTLHRVVHAVILGYISISVPVHVRSFFTDDVGDLTGVFPTWYSGVFLVIASAMLVHIWRLRFVSPADLQARAEEPPVRPSLR